MSEELLGNKGPEDLLIVRRKKRRVEGTRMQNKCLEYEETRIFEEQGCREVA